VLKPILCLFDKHAPIRATAHWDGEGYIGECRYCGRKIRRHSRGNWKNDAGRLQDQADTAPEPVKPPPQSSS
jgi:hypothetical protein